MSIFYLKVKNITANTNARMYLILYFAKKTLNLFIVLFMMTSSAIICSPLFLSLLLQVVCLLFERDSRVTQAFRRR